MKALAETLLTKEERCFRPAAVKPWILSKDVVLAVQYSKYSKFT